MYCVGVERGGGGRWEGDVWVGVWGESGKEWLSTLSDQLTVKGAVKRNTQLHRLKPDINVKNRNGVLKPASCSHPLPHTRKFICVMWNHIMRPYNDQTWRRTRAEFGFSAWLQSHNKSASWVAASCVALAIHRAVQPMQDKIMWLGNKTLLPR